jgi:hypothetical protein
LFSTVNSIHTTKKAFALPTQRLDASEQAETVALASAGLSFKHERAPAV